MQSLENGTRLTVKFDQDKVIISEYKTDNKLGVSSFGTLDKVQYDTKIGSSMIVFDKGVTSPFNTRIHGGEISLKSWFGFTKYLHVNCTGFILEGRYPED